MLEALVGLVNPSPKSREGVLGYPGSLRDSHVYFLIALVACIIYGKSVIYQYTYVDDIYLVVVNHDLLSNLANIPKLFTTDVFISVADPVVFYRPLMNLLFMLELQLSNNSPVIFHVTNIALHIACSVLLFAVFKQLKISRTLSIASALVFCAHPLNTSAVVWIPGRNDTLLTFFVLASLWMFLRALDTKRPVFMAGHLLFFLLALLTKESAFAIPLLTMTYIFFISKESSSSVTIASALAAYAVLVVIWVLLRSMVTRTFEVHTSMASLALNWLHNSPAFILYVGKVLFPFSFSVFPNLMDQSLLPGILALLVFAVVYFLKKPASNRELIWGLGWFLFFLAPTLLSGTIAYEHRGYCALIGLLFATAQLPLLQKINFERPAYVLGLVVVLGFYGVVAMVHSEYFRNRTAFATNAFLTAPSVDESYSALGGLYLDEGDYASAERVLRAGIARNPVMKSVHRMLGNVYAKRHEYARGANEFETSIRLEPLQLYTYIDYGTMCLEANRPDDAARLWKRSVFINPDFLLGYEYLANYYIYTKHNPDSAMIYAKQIQEHGVPVLPELLRDIQRDPNLGKTNQ